MKTNKSKTYTITAKVGATGATFVYDIEVEHGALPKSTQDGHTGRLADFELRQMLAFGVDKMIANELGVEWEFAEKK